MKKEFIFITDAQVHIWELSTPQHPWPLPPPPAPPHRPQPFSKDELLREMDHLSLHARKKDGEAFADLDKLLALAKRPNVAAKATCLPSYAGDSYPYRSLHPYLRRVCDAFGPRRIFWGTDRTRLPCSYRQAITMFTEEIPWLTAEDKEWIMGRGVCEWLG